MGTEGNNVVCLVLKRPPSQHEETPGRIDLEAEGRDIPCNRMLPSAYSSNVIGGNPVVDKEEA